MSFNYDILDSDNSIMVDPMNVELIADAINRMKNSKNIRMKMSQASIERAKKLTINKRATAILNFIQGKLNNLTK